MVLTALAKVSAGAAIGAALGTLLYVLLVITYRYIRRQPPGPILRIPYWGDSFAVIDQGFPRYQRRLSAIYGSIFRTTLFGESTVSICDPVHIQSLLQVESATVAADWPKSARVLLGDGVLNNLKGSAHNTLRQVLEPGMTQDAVSARLPLVIRVMNERLKAWARHPKVNIYFKSKEIPFMVTLMTVLGYRNSEVTLTVLEQLSKAFSVFNRAVFSLAIDQPDFDYHHALRAKEGAISEQLDLHLQRLRDREMEGTLGQQPGELLLGARDEQGELLSDKVIKENMLALLYSAQDPTANVMCHLVIELGRHNRILTKLQAEQAKISEIYGDEISDALDHMPYADAVLKEIMRLRPTVGGVFRRALKAFDLGPYHITKGTKLLLGMGNMNRAPPCWAAEGGDLAINKFYPERWLTPQGQLNGNFIPFGSGHRKCLGQRLATMELRVFLIMLVRGYTWTLLDRYVEYFYFPFIIPCDDAMVAFKERNPA